MNSIALRIKELIDDKSLNNSEFAKVIGVNPSIISHIMSGRNKVSLQIIEAIRDTFTNVNIDYLISGEGALLKNVTNVNTMGDILPAAMNTGSAFPMEGVRHAAIPGTPTPPPAEETPNPSPDKAEESQEQTSPELERVILFYKDGSFKTYIPQVS